MTVRALMKGAGFAAAACVGGHSLRLFKKNKKKQHLNEDPEYAKWSEEQNRIRKSQSGEWDVYSTDGDRKLGCYEGRILKSIDDNDNAAMLISTRITMRITTMTMITMR